VTRTQAQLALLVVLLATAWLVVGTGGVLPPLRGDQTHSNDAIRDQPAVGGLPERAEALRAYLATPRPPVPVRRNPFNFREPSRAVPERGGPGPAVEIPAPKAPPPRPDMALSGIAEDTTSGRPARTAVISTLGQLVFAREGDRVLSRFLVVRIAQDAVQLQDGEGGQVFTLALK
jgi:hypothetical protein